MALREGTVTDAEGLPVEGAVVAAGEHDGTYDMRSDESVTETWTFRHATTDAEGHYRFGTLALGETPLAVRMRTKPGGTLVLHIGSSEEHPPLDVEGSLAVGGYRHREEFQLGSVSPMRFESVEAGPGKVTFFGQNIKMGSHEFEIRAGEETVLDVELTPAVGVPYRIDLPKTEGGVSLVARFVDLADGAEAGEIELKDLSRYPTHIEFEMKLGVGSYRMEAELSDGLRGAVEF